MIVVGAGAAGATAAALLAQSGHPVCVVDRREFAGGPPQPAWLNADALGMLKTLNIKPDAIGAEPITQLTFVKADASGHRDVTFKKPRAYVIDRTALGAALVAAAGAAGAVVRRGADVVDAAALEDHVTVTLADAPALEAKLVLGADGVESLVAERLSRSGSAGRRAGGWCCQMPLAGAGEGPPITLILGVESARAFGYVLRSGAGAGVGLAGIAEQATLAPLLERMLTRLRDAGLLNGRPAVDPDTLDTWRSPAGAALEYDGHVAKRALLIGNAGGFVASVSHEAIWPAMWSAKIATAVLRRALTADNAQDELIRFDAQWRTTLADYLRMPNTDMQFLMPLIFSNQQIADRMATAFLTGENI